MPVDDTKIKDALNSFEDDDFISAKDTLKQEIKSAVTDYFRDKLELKQSSDTTGTEGEGEGEGEAGTTAPEGEGEGEGEGESGSTTGDGSGE